MIAAGWGEHLVQLLPAHGLQGQQRQVAAVQRGQRQRVHHLRVVGSQRSFGIQNHLRGALRLMAPTTDLQRRPSDLRAGRCGRCTCALSGCRRLGAVNWNVSRYQRAALERVQKTAPKLTARLRLTRAANWYRPAVSVRATSAPTFTIATGPLILSWTAPKLKTICCSPAAHATSTGSERYPSAVHLRCLIVGIGQQSRQCSVDYVSCANRLAGLHLW